MESISKTTTNATIFTSFRKCEWKDEKEELSGYIKLGQYSTYIEFVESNIDTLNDLIKNIEEGRVSLYISSFIGSSKAWDEGGGLYKKVMKTEAVWFPKIPKTAYGLATVLYVLLEMSEDVVFIGNHMYFLSSSDVKVKLITEKSQYLSAVDCSIKALFSLLKGKGVFKKNHTYNLFTVLGGEKPTTIIGLSDDAYEAIISGNEHYHSVMWEALPPNPYIYNSDINQLMFVSDFKKFPVGTKRSSLCRLTSSDIVAKCYHFCCVSNKKPLGAPKGCRFYQQADIDVEHTFEDETSMLSKTIDTVGELVSKSSSFLKSIYESFVDGTLKTVTAVRKKISTQFLQDFVKTHARDMVMMVVDFATIIIVYYKTKDLTAALLLLPALMLHWGLEKDAYGAIKDRLEDRGDEVTQLHNPLILLGTFAAILVAKILGNYDIVRFDNISKVITTLAVAGTVSTYLSDFVDYFAVLLPDCVTKFVSESLPYSVMAGYWHLNRCRIFLQSPLPDQEIKRNKMDFVNHYEKLGECISSSAMAVSFATTSLQRQHAAMAARYTYIKYTVTDDNIPRPTIVFIHGSAGIGKTHFAKHIAENFCHIYSPDNKGIYLRNVGTTHWDAYRGQKVIQYNDQDALDMSQVVTEIMMFHDGNGPILPSASLSDPGIGVKGTRMSSFLIIITSNSAPDKWELGKVDRAAFFRRLDIIVHMKNPRTCTDDDFDYNEMNCVFSTITLDQMQKGLNKRVILDSKQGYETCIALGLKLIKDDRMRAEADIVEGGNRMFSEQEVDEICQGKVPFYDWFVKSSNHASLEYYVNSFGKKKAWADVDTDTIRQIFQSWRNPRTEQLVLASVCPDRYANGIINLKAFLAGTLEKATSEITYGSYPLMRVRSGLDYDCSLRIHMSMLWDRVVETRFQDFRGSIDDLVCLSTWEDYTPCDSNKCKYCQSLQEPWYKKHKLLLLAAGGLAAAVGVAVVGNKLYNMFAEQMHYTKYDPTKTEAKKREYDTAVSKTATFGESTHSLLSEQRDALVEKMTATFYLPGITFRGILPKANYVIIPRHYWDNYLRERYDEGARTIPVEIIVGGSTQLIRDKLLLHTYRPCPQHEDEDIGIIQVDKLCMKDRMSAFCDTSVSSNILSSLRVEGILIGCPLSRDKAPRRVSTLLEPMTREWYDEGFPTRNTVVKYKVTGWKMPGTCLFDGDCGCIAYHSSDTQNVGYVLGMYTGSYKGYGRIQIITREMINSMIDSVCIKETFVEEYSAINDESPRFKMSEEHEHLQVVGRLSAKTSVHAPALTTFKKSILHPDLNGRVPWGPDLKEPVILSPSDPRFGERGFTISPLRKAVGFGNCENTFPNDVLCKSLELLKQSFFRLPKPHHASVISLHDAINGIDGRPFIKGIDITTSPGFPYISYRKFGGRKDYFGVDGVTKYMSSAMLRNIYHERVAYYRKRIPYMTMWMDVPKDEKLKKTKIESNSVRIFNVGPIDLLILMKQYFACFMEWFYENRIKGFWAPGIDIKSDELIDLIDNLQELSDRIIDADYEKWDKVLHEQLMEDLDELFNEWYQVYDPKYTVEDDNIRTMCIYAMIDRTHVVGDLVYRTRYGNCSGGLLTVIINCIANLRLVYCFIADRYKFEGKLGDLDFETVRRCIYLMTYGDDLLQSISPIWQSWFTGEAFRAYVSHYGMKVTAGNKEALIAPADITEVVFLKCHFRRVPGHNVWYPILDKRSIDSCLAWQQKSSLSVSEDDVLASEINSALEWLVFYGASVFKLYRNTILRIVDGVVAQKIRTAEDIFGALNYSPQNKRVLIAHLGFRVRVHEF